MKYRIGLILIAFLLISCDPSIGYEYYLNNQSDSILIVQLKGKRSSAINDTIKQVLPQTEVLIYESEVRGSNPHDEKTDFLRMFDTISIMTNSKIPIKKDIYDRNNWEYDSDISHWGLIKTGTNIYRLKLSNDDLE